MNRSKSLYLSVLKSFAVSLRLIKRNIYKLFPRRKADLKKQRTLEILSSLSYRTGKLKDYLQLVAVSVSELLDLNWTVVTLCRDGYERVLASSIEIGFGEDDKIAIHGSLTETVVKSGRCLFVEDTSINKEHGEPPEGYLAYLGAPLRLPDGEIIGTICSFHRRPRKFSLNDMRLVEIFAERAATAIDNYNLYQQQQEINQAFQAEIEERRVAEQLLKKSEEQLRQIADNLEPLLWLYSHEAEPIYMSPMFEKVWGVPLEQWYADGSVCLNSVHPEDREHVSTLFKQVFTDKNSYNLEYRIIHPDGRIKIIRDRGFPIIDQLGQIYRVAGISEDITERRQEEKRNIKAMERLSEIGELAASIVHEVRNPLTTVLMGLNFFQKMDLPDHAEKRLMLALDEAERLKQLLNEILLYAKHEIIKPQPTDLNELIIDCIENIASIHTTIGEKIYYKPPSEPIIVLGDRDKLKQVVINLLQNACEAISEGEEITVCASSLTASRHICMQVKNGGKAIAPEALSQLTKPFFTTKSSGNGLGLAIVKKIVEAHDGKLEIESSEISGTIISVILPSSI
jgi:PAS domain S-box-containing protein